MLEVTFYRDARNRRSAIAALGHADSAREGQDLVCAAVSAILQAARLGLERHANVDLEVVQRPGELLLRWPAKVRSNAAVEAIVATAELSVAAIARQHPKHVRVRRATG